MLVKWTAQPLRMTGLFLIKDSPLYTSLLKNASHSVDWLYCSLHALYNIRKQTQFGQG